MVVAVGHAPPLCATVKSRVNWVIPVQPTWLAAGPSAKGEAGSVTVAVSAVRLSPGVGVISGTTVR